MTVKRKTRRAPFIFFLFIPVFFPFVLQSQPSIPSVIEGSAIFDHQGQLFTITTDGMKTIIDWEGFSISSGETTHFDQPSFDAITLNRVTSQETSAILGSLTSNGSLYLINPNGIVIGESGVIDVNGLVASTLDISNNEFLTGGTILFSGNSEASIENSGLIEGRDYGVILLGRYLINRGDIAALTGRVELGAGSSVWLNTDQGNIFIEPEIPTQISGTGIENSGDIRAAYVDLRADGSLYTLAIHHSGQIDATASMELNGEVYLVASGGTTVVDGEGTITSMGQDGTNGSIEVLGNTVSLLDQANLIIENAFGGGHIFVGGSLGGADESIPNAATTTVGPEANIQASGGQIGNGGEVSIFGTTLAEFQGSIKATGGTIQGNGGYVEISKQPVFNGTVDTTASNGIVGTLVFDPTDITISGAATSGGSFDGGSPTNTFSGTAGTATLNNANLNTALQTNNVVVTTSSIFGGTGNITIAAATNLTVPAARTLTLNADNNIVVSSSLTMTDLGVGTSSLIFTAGNNITLNSTVTGTNLASIDMTAGATLDLDSTLSASNATVTLAATNLTSTGGGTNTITAGQCNLTASNDITITNDINFTGNGSGSSLDITAGNLFNHNNTMRFADWESVSLNTPNNNYVIDNGITTTNVTTVAITSGQDLINQGGTNLFNDVTSQTTALTMTATNDIVINSQLDINNFLSATLNAGNDFTLNSDFEPDNTTTVTVTTGNDIDMTNSSADVIASNATTLSFLATNNFTSGEPFVLTNIGTLDITATTGNVDIGSGTTFSLTGVDQVNLNATTNDLNINQVVLVNNSTGNILLSAGNDINIGSSTATSPSIVGTRTGTVAVLASRDLNVIGGGSSDRAQIGFSLGSSVNSDIELTIGRDINVTAGNNSNAVALIGHGFSNIDGNYNGDIIFHSVGGDVTLSGDTGTLGSIKYAQIGHARGGGSNTVTFSGDIRGSTPGSFAVIDGTLQLNGGADAESYALFGHGGQDSNGNESYSGAIRVQANAIELIGGTSSDCEAAIGFFVTAQTGGSNPVTIGPTATAEVISDTDLTMTGNSNGIVSIGGRVLNTAAHPASISLDLVRVETGGNLTMTSGTGAETDATIGALTENGIGAVTNLAIESQGQLALNAGAGAAAQIMNGSGAVTAVTITTVEAAGDITFAVTGTFAAKIEAVTGTLTTLAGGTLTLPNLTSITNQGGSDGTLSVTAGEMVVQNGGLIANSGLGATKAETTQGGFFLFDSSTITSIGNLTCKAATDFSLLNDASCQVTGGELSVIAEESISIIGATSGPSFCASTGEATYTAGTDIFLQGTALASEGYIQNDAGNLTLTAGENLEVHPFGRAETLGTGTLTLIADNQAPTAPAIGTGSFRLSSLGTVATGGGALRIFTALRSQNSIVGTGNLNGATFTPGPLFVNTATEQWNTYFPSSFGGVPFTIFYKNSAPTAETIPSIENLLAIDGNLLTPFFELFYLLDNTPIDPVVAWLYKLPVDDNLLCAEKENRSFCSVSPIAIKKLPPYTKKLSLLGP
ncbi:MAG: filamentous hemagglutinin N-terminal domain-containing protein [Chlamydiota bacterium]